MEFSKNNTISITVTAIIVSAIILLTTFTSYSQPVSMTIYDTTSPVIVSVEAASPVNSHPITISYQAEDVLSGVENVKLYEFTGSAWEETEFSSPDSSGTLTHTNLLGDGTYRLAVVATDFAGNSTTPEEGEVTVIVDSEPPTVELIGSNTITLSEDVTYQEPGVTATDAISGDVTSTVTATTSLTQAPGIFEVAYTAEDEVGNVSEPVTRTVVIDNYIEAEEQVLNLVADQLQLAAMEFAYQTVQGKLAKLEQNKQQVETELQETKTQLATVIAQSGDTIMALNEEYQQDRERLAELTAVVKNSRKFRRFIIIIEQWLPEWFNE